MEWKCVYTNGFNYVTVTMDMTINNSATTDSLVACDTAMWNGIPYTTTGIYTQTFLTTQGCDSIVTMDITIHNKLSNFEIQSACDEYLWNGNIYTSTGTLYRHTSDHSWL